MEIFLKLDWEDARTTLGIDLNSMSVTLYMGKWYSMRIICQEGFSRHD